jgi:hypothetical protein
MFIRMNDGRDRGHVLDIAFDVAQDLLARGQALPVDLTQPGAMEFRDPLKLVVPPLAVAVLGDVLLEGVLGNEPKPLAAPAEAASVAPKRAEGHSFGKPAGSFATRLKRR